MTAKHTFCLVIQHGVGLEGGGGNTGNKTWQSVEQINRYITQMHEIHKATLLLFTSTCFGHFDHLMGEYDTHFGRFCRLNFGDYK